MAGCDSNLTSEVNSFVGRAHEINVIDALFAEGSRLVSVVGFAGAGKTRLARQYAAHRHDSDRALQAVWFWDLTSARTTSQILVIACQAMRISSSGASPASDSLDNLGAVLARRGRVLVVADNFEQLVDSAGETLGSWLQTCPELQFLVTSRSALQIKGERVVRLTQLTQQQGERLFLDRAETPPNGGWSEDDLSSVAQIVRRLDGLPLAIELAAARVGVLSPQQLSERLIESIDVLRNLRRDAPDRHETLRAAIDWSWKLLPTTHRRALALCSIFCGGLAVEAAEAMLHDDAKSIAAIDVLQDLVNCSLLQTQTSTTGNRRFVLFECVREFAWRELCQKGEDKAARARHAEVMVELAESRIHPMRGAETQAALAWLSAELDNLVAVVRCRDIDAGLIVRAALAANALLTVKGPFALRLELLEVAVDAAQRSNSESLDARALLAREEAHGLDGGQVDDNLARVYELAQSCGDDELMCASLLLLGNAQRFNGALAKARSSYERAVSLAHDIGDSWMVTRTLDGLALLLCDLGLLQEARELFGQALSISIRDKHATLEALVRAHVARINMEEGNIDEAEQHLARALETHRKLDNFPQRQAWLLATRGDLLLKSSRIGEARTVFEETIALAKRIDLIRYEGVAIGNLGLCDQLEERFADAKRRLAATVEIYRELEPPLATFFLAHLGAFECRDNLDRGVELLAQARHELTEVMSHQETLDVLDGFADVARARQFATVDDMEQAHESLRSARTRIHTALSGGGEPSQGKGRKATSSDAVLAAGLLQREIDRLPEWSNKYPDATANCLIVGPQGSWFVAPDGRRGHLEHRPTLRRLLWTLISSRRARPGEGSSVKTLFAACWPGEVASTASASSRVRTAVATLRRMGLAKVLVRGPDGYLIEASMEVAVRGV